MPGCPRDNKGGNGEAMGAVKSKGTANDRNQGPRPKRVGTFVGLTRGRELVLES